ncbi:MAG: tRNA uracil 4-sulfurtransferase ThiI [Caldicoprobacterales bacterium]|jgi:thiamine biosynthesis protein ThiI|nr:tRNA 4-thiouridine(8) synthase ThiI [Clostridiales bacterium]
MERLILIRYGEIYLKGQNRPFFEKTLINNIKKTLEPFGQPKVFKAQGRIYVENLQVERVVLDRLSKVFGAIGINPAWKTDKDLESIKTMVKTAMKDALEKTTKDNITFKVESRRADKNFPIGSMDLSREMGGFILKSFPGLKVDVHNPDIKLNIEIREHAYAYHENIPGAGGMPVGTNGKTALLLSGGIDSPVAGWMIAKRGVKLTAIHYHSFPYTSDKSKEKVVDLCRLLTQYCGPIRLHVVPFTEIQQELYEKCPDGLLTILMRRFMMRIAEIIAQNEGAQALVTGESIGQVASQTLEALASTDDAVSMPVFRPLIGLDKNEIVEIAEKINTYETSILPYEDCCTVFVPRHPVTRPKLDRVRKAETFVNAEALIQRALEDIEIYDL